MIRRVVENASEGCHPARNPGLMTVCSLADGRSGASRNLRRCVVLSG